MSPRIQAAYGLSPLQEGLLFHALTAGRSGAYCNQTALRVAGELPIEPIRAAWRELCARHDVLRTAFAWKRQARALQLVWSEVEPPVIALDWSDDPDWRVRAERFLEDDQRAGFDLARPPLFRIHVIRLPGSAQLLVMTHHHVILDGWSSVRLRAELTEILAARAAGRPPALAQAVPFRRYIALLEGRSPAKAEAFWRDALAGFIEPTPISDSSARRPTTSAGHALLAHSLSGTQSESVQRFARAHGLTLNTLFAGAWALVLSRVTGRDDVVMGLTVSGRPTSLPGAESMIGLFINTLPLRVRCRPESETITWLRELQRTRLATEPHETTPLTAIHAASELTADQSLFDHALVFENYARAPSTSPAHSARGAEVFRHHQTTHFAVTLYVMPREVLDVELRYDPSRVSKARASALLQAWLSVLTQICDDEPRPIGSIALVVPERRDAWLARGRCPLPVPPSTTVIERFDEAVERHGPSLAVIDGEQRVSYRSLAQRTHAVAARLERAGVRAGDRVGLCLPRSLDAIAAILGIWRSGAMYVPLDPEDPQERLTAILENAGVRHVVSGGTHADHLPASANVVEVPASSEAPVDRTRTAVALSPHAPAYVMYTSGTTGRPKGIPVAHRSVVALADAGCSPVGPGDVVGHCASLCFDTSGFELWTALMHGATLYVIERQALLSTEALRAHIERGSIDLLLLTPVLFNQHVDRDPAVFAGVAQVVVGGEASDPDHVRRALESPQPPSRLLNVYGPTEAAIWSTASVLTRPVSEHEPLPIGTPLPGWEAHVLDTALQPVPDGVIGTLFLGGIGLAHGYWRSPGRTAQSFVPNPFATTPGERLYDTGDRVYRREDGQLAFVGRADGQIKLRGFRIEPGEIEAALRECPGISDAVVGLERTASGDRQLVAWWVPEVDRRISREELRRELARRLPSYMLPSAMIEIEALPLTPRGKLDRRALPAPERASDRAGAAESEARSLVEQMLAEIWCELLGLTHVGIHDDFFALGGHSLLAVQVIERARGQLGLAEQLPLTVLFDAPTIAQLAAHLSDASRAPTTPLVVLRASGARPPLFCFHPAGGHVSGYRRLADRLRDQPVFGIQARALLDPALRADSIEALAEDYARVLLEQHPHGPWRLLGWSSGALIAHAVGERVLRQGGAVDFIGLVDPPTPGRTATSASDPGDSLVDRTIRMLGASPEDAVLPSLSAEVRARFEATLRALPDDDARLAAAVAYAHAEGILPRSVSLEVCRLRNATLAHAQALHARYCPNALKAPVHIWLAGHGTPDPAAAIERWSRFVEPRPRVEVVSDTDHRSVIASTALARALAARLAELRDDRSRP